MLLVLLVAYVICVTIEHGNRTYYFIAVDIAEQRESASQRDKGKLVAVNKVQLSELVVQAAN